MRRVWPGLEEVRAMAELLSRALRRDDFPTLERPRNATWGDISFCYQVMGYGH